MGQVTCEEEQKKFQKTSTKAKVKLQAAICAYW
jgi:hypothetical protein